MSDFEQLILILGAIYAIECIAWVPHGSVAIIRFMGPLAWLTYPMRLLADRRGGPCVMSPWPMSANFLCAPPSLAYTPTAVARMDGEQANAGTTAQADAATALNEIKRVTTSDDALYVDGRMLAQFVTPKVARREARFLRRLVHLPEEQRSGAIAGHLAQQFDVAAAARRIRQFDRRLRMLRLATVFLMVFLFVLLPSLHFSVGLLRWWWALIPTYIVLQLAIVSEFVALHGRYEPRQKSQRVRHALLMAMAPTAAMRGFDALSRSLLAEFHPLTVAATVLPRPAFHALAQKTFLQMLYPPQRPDTDASTPRARVVDASNTELARTLRAWLPSQGIAPETILAPPEAHDQRCKSYCPRCHGQFVEPTATCVSCGGVAALPLSINSTR